MFKQYKSIAIKKYVNQNHSTLTMHYMTLNNYGEKFMEYVMYNTYQEVILHRQHRRMRQHVEEKINPIGGMYR